MQIEPAYPDLEITEDSLRSVKSLLPAAVGSYLGVIPEEVWMMDEEELEKACKAGPSDMLLRHAFWLEYGRAQRSGGKMSPANIYGGIVSKHLFFKEIVTNTYRLAYIATPPTDYSTRLEELLTMGLRQYREILALPNVNAKGQVDSRLVSVKQKIIEDVANRTRGQVVQRLEVQSKNLNVNVDQTSQHRARTVEEIEAELKALEAQKPAPLLIPEHCGGTSYANETSDEHEVVEVEYEQKI